MVVVECKKSVKENSSDALQEKPQNQPLDSAVDELNLAEFPLAAISDRFLDGTKTVVLEDTVFDRDQNKYLPRRLTLSGSDRYGLPTSKDDDVLLACIQLSTVLFVGSLIYWAAPALWWVDATAGLALTLLIVREGIEGIRAARRPDFSGGCGCHT